MEPRNSQVPVYAPTHNSVADPRGGTPSAPPYRPKCSRFHAVFSEKLIQITCWRRELAPPSMELLDPPLQLPSEIDPTRLVSETVGMHLFFQRQRSQIPE